MQHNERPSTANDQAGLPQPGRHSHRLRGRARLQSTLLRFDWYALRLLNYLRLFLLIAFAATFYIAEGAGVLGIRDPQLFIYIHLSWLLLALCFNSFIRLREPGLETQFYLQCYIDIVMICVLIYSSGGIDSGLGIILVMHIAIIANFARQRFTLAFAAIATAMLISQELFARAQFGEWAVNLVGTALLGATLFIVAIVTSTLIRRYQQTTPGSTERELSFKQVAELNQKIIQEMHSGVLYVDHNDRVRLINQSAAQMLSTDGLSLPAHLGLLSEPLYDALRQWRKSPASANRSLVHKSLHSDLLMQFSGLNDKGTLIKLDDHHAIKAQLQQLKLASLGRLTTSIAHEIRNPLGAISNAVQLLQESDTSTQDDLHLVNIAHRHTERINRIIEDVMQLSTRKTAAAELIDLAQVLSEFSTRFCEQNNLPDSVISIDNQPATAILFDLHHLDQILWNLCQNALDHNDNPSPLISISSYAGDDAVILEIKDNGSGIDASELDSVFEPFFTTRHGGTGLGLYIIRELCEMNHANVECIAVNSGACFRVTLPIPRAMAA